MVAGSRVLPCLLSWPCWLWSLARLRPSLPRNARQEVPRHGADVNRALSTTQGRHWASSGEAERAQLTQHLSLWI